MDLHVYVQKVSTFPYGLGEMCGAYQGLCIMDNSFRLQFILFSRISVRPYLACGSKAGIKTDP